ncbi:KAP family P-loop NTPase fold protein [Colwellia sp. MEBiC06753]
MEFKSHKIKVDQSNPFYHDKLNRKPHVDNFSILLENVKAPTVFSVNAPWGQGKTTFLEMLHANLRNKGKHSIFFSAWETDFATDPLQAFIGEINNQIELLINGDKEKNKAWETTKKAGAHILKKGVPAFVKVATAGVLDTEKLIEDETAKLLEGFTSDFLKDYTTKKEAISQFKAGVAKVLSNKEGGATQLFIFIDELDRCRPTYAIELLERVKHLLDIEGLVFVLAMDKLQLSHSVKGVYGNDFEALGYLRRFIDIEYTLPEADLGAFIEHQFVNFGFNTFFQARMQYSEFQYDGQNLKDIFKILANAKRLSLREVEQLFSKVNLVVLATGQGVRLYPILLVFLLIVKEYYFEDYDNYMNKGNTPEKLIEILYSLIPESELVELHIGALIEAFLIAAKNLDDNSRLGMSLSRHQNMLSAANGSKEQIRYARKIIGIVESIDRYNNTISLTSIKHRIDMIEAFDFAD